MRFVAALILTVFSMWVLASAVDLSRETVPYARSYVIEHGQRETGAANLVTSIYLGYRVFDTLGETLVLFTVVTGVVFILGYKKEG